MLSWLVSRIIPYDAGYSLTDGKYFSCNGDIFWTKNGKLHREDGPAEIYPNWEQYWHINGHNITDKIHKWAKDRDSDLNNLTDIDKMIIKLEWGNYGK